MIDAVGASSYNMFVAAMPERALLAPGHSAVWLPQALLPQGSGGRQQYIYAAPAILDAPAENAINSVSQLLFCSWRWAAPLSGFQGSPAAPLCGEERCAGSFCTNGMRGDAFENVASVLQAR